MTGHQRETTLAGVERARLIVGKYAEPATPPDYLPPPKDDLSALIARLTGL